MGEPRYAEKVDPSELEIDWSEDRAAIRRLVRLGGAWTTVGGKRLKIWRLADVERPLHDLGPGVAQGTVVGTGRMPVRLVEVQPEGKGRMDAEAWSNGARIPDGTALGT